MSVAGTGHRAGHDWTTLIVATSFTDRSTWVTSDWKVTYSDPPEAWMPRSPSSPTARAVARRLRGAVYCAALALALVSLAVPPRWPRSVSRRRLRRPR